MISDKRIRLYGSGGHSQVIVDLLNSQGYEITAIYDDNPLGKHPASKEVFAGIKTNPSKFPHFGDPIIIAIGDNSIRLKLSNLLKSNYTIAIHNSAIINRYAIIGIGTVIYAGAIVQTNTTIGKHVIINTGAIVNYGCSISNYAHIAPKVGVSSYVEVGEGSFVGAGAVIIRNVTIGKWCTIGAGTVVIKDVPDYATVVGNPGRVIKYNKQ